MHINTYSSFFKLFFRFKDFAVMKKNNNFLTLWKNASSKDLTG